MVSPSRPVGRMPPGPQGQKQFRAAIWGVKTL